MPAAPHRRVTAAVAPVLLVLVLLVLALLVLSLGTTPSTAARTSGEVSWKVAPGVE
jgi:hypothetical protein